MSMSIGRLILMLACVCHIACCVWWYIGTVDVDTHAHNYGYLVDLHEAETFSAPDSEGAPVQDDHLDGTHRQLLAGGGPRRPVDPNQPPYDESMLGVYEPPGRAFMDSWIFYYQGLGEEDIWSDEYVSQSQSLPCACIHRLCGLDLCILQYLLPACKQVRV